MIQVQQKLSLKKSKFTACLPANPAKKSKSTRDKSKITVKKSKSTTPFACNQAKKV